VIDACHGLGLGHESRVTKCDPLSALLHTVVKLNTEGAFSDEFYEFYFIFKRLGQL